MRSFISFSSPSFHLLSPVPMQPGWVWQGPRWRHGGKPQNLGTYHKDEVLPKVCSMDHDLYKMSMDNQRKEDFRGPNVVKLGGLHKTEPVSSFH